MRKSTRSVIVGWRTLRLLITGLCFSFVSGVGSGVLMKARKNPSSSCFDSNIAALGLFIFAMCADCDSDSVSFPR